MRRNVRVGQLIRPGVSRANRVASIDRRLSQSYLTVLADQLFDKELLLSGQSGLCCYRGTAPGLHGFAGELRRSLSCRHRFLS